MVDLDRRAGTYVYKSSGARYSGDWAENKKSGTGELLMPDKGKYVGDFKDDKRTGQGTYTYPNGDSYTGGWLDGVKHGRGTYTYAAGGSGGSGVVAGNWVHGRLLQGQWDIPDGSKYIGTFTQNTPSGQLLSPLSCVRCSCSACGLVWFRRRRSAGALERHRAQRSFRRGQVRSGRVREARPRCGPLRARGLGSGPFQADAAYGGQGGPQGRPLRRHPQAPQGDRRQVLCSLSAWLDRLTC